MAKGKFLDAHENAPGCGVVIALFGVMILMFSFGNPFVAENTSDISTLTLIEGIILVITGYGLYKRKMFGIYGLGLLLLMSIGGFLYNLAQGFTVRESLSWTLIIYPLLLWWFYSAKKLFK